jgi:WD40 repeat protein
MKVRLFFLTVLVFSTTAPISAENAGALALRHVLGYGRFTSVSTAGDTALVGSSAGLWVVEGESVRLFGNVDFPVEQVAVDPTGAALATADFNGKIRLWDAASETLRAEMTYCCRVLDLAFDRTGQILASAHEGDDGVVLWDALTGGQTAILDEFDLPEAVDFSPQRDVLAVADDNRVFIWDIQGERIRGQWPTSLILDMAFSADDIQLVSGHGDGAVRVWDNRTGEAVRAFSGDTSGIVSVSLSADGTRLAVVGRTRLDIRDFESGALIASFEGQFLDAAWAGEQLAFIDEASLSLWDGAEPRLAAGNDGFAFQEFAFSSDGRLIFAHMSANVSCQADFAGEALLVWDVESGEDITCLPPAIPAFVLTGRWRPGTHTLLWDDGLTTRLIDLDTGEETPILEDFFFDENGLAFSPDGSLLALALEGETALFDLDSQTITQTLVRTSDFSTSGAAFSPTGKYFAAATSGPGLINSVLLAWDVTERFPIANVDLGESTEEARLFFDEDLQLLVVVADTQVWLVDLAERQLRQNFPVIDAAYHAESHLLVWSDDAGLNFWNLGTDAHSAVSEEARFSRLAFSPDGTVLAAAVAPPDTVELFSCLGLQLWDVAGQTLAAAFDSPACVEELQFSPDGARLAALDASGTIKVWGILE